jgi:hypothetical protein
LKNKGKHVVSNSQGHVVVPDKEAIRTYSGFPKITSCLEARATGNVQQARPVHLITYTTENQNNY